MVLSGSCIRAANDAGRSCSGCSLDKRRIFFTGSSVDGHLGSVQVLALEDRAVTNTHRDVCIFLN